MAERDRYTLGLSGEAQAEEYLTGLGMTCVARRYRGEGGELDLIMRENRMIVFVEVKLRKGKSGSGLMAVTYDKQQRMRRAAAIYMAEHPNDECYARFDVVEITQDGIVHIPDAFR